MSKSISILDKDYIQWIKDLSRRYRQSQIKAAVRVNEEICCSKLLQIPMSKLKYNDNSPTAKKMKK